MLKFAGFAALASVTVFSGVGLLGYAGIAFAGSAMGMTLGSAVTSALGTIVGGVLSARVGGSLLQEGGYLYARYVDVYNEDTGKHKCLSLNVFANMVDSAIAITRWGK